MSPKSPPLKLQQRRSTRNMPACEIARRKEQDEKYALLHLYRKQWRLQPKANLTDCRFQGAGNQCRGRVCCPTGSAAAGKCRRSMDECLISGIHPDQRGGRVRSLSKYEIAAIRDGILSKQDVRDHVWTQAVIDEIRDNVAINAELAEMMRVRDAQIVAKVHKQQQQQRHASRKIVVKGSLEHKTRRSKVRAERRMDADIIVGAHLQKRMSI